MILDPALQTLVDQAQQLADETGKPYHVCVSSMVDMHRRHDPGLVPTTLRWGIRSDPLVQTPGRHVVVTCVPEA